MDKNTVEAMTRVLSELSCIPSFNNALLFSDEIASIVGFQIKCILNNQGRLVFSVCAFEEAGLTKEESLDIFSDFFQQIHGNPVRKLGKHDIHTNNYPTTGTDYAEDVSPSTIVRIVKLASETDSSGGDSIIPAYILRLTKEVSRWSQYFEKLYSKANALSQNLNQILDGSFSN